MNMNVPIKSSDAITVIGLGYVGLPLAVEFGKKRPVVGFDVNQGRIDALRNGVDSTREVGKDELRSATHLSLQSDPEALRDCRVFIGTVPPQST